MNVLGMFVKRPEPGRVKTRLAKTLGGAVAAELYDAFTRDLAVRFHGSANRRFLCCTPDDAATTQHFQDLAGTDYELWTQPTTSLGGRLTAFFECAFSVGAKRVVVIGSDSPTLPRDFVENAFQQLKLHDTVIGPATDGGYYLIGLSHHNWPIFDEIDWSGPTVLGQTTERIRDCDATLSSLSVWYDVDSFDDLQFLRGHLLTLRNSGEDTDCPRTERLVDAWDFPDPATL